MGSLRCQPKLSALSYQLHGFAVCLYHLHGFIHPAVPVTWVRAACQYHFHGFCGEPERGSRCGLLYLTHESGTPRVRSHGRRIQGRQTSDPPELAEESLREIVTAKCLLILLVRLRAADRIYGFGGLRTLDRRPVPWVVGNLWHGSLCGKCGHRTWSRRANLWTRRF